MKYSKDVLEDKVKDIPYTAEWEEKNIYIRELEGQYSKFNIRQRKKKGRERETEKKKENWDGGGEEKWENIPWWPSW